MLPDAVSATSAFRETLPAATEPRVDLRLDLFERAMSAGGFPASAKAQAMGSPAALSDRLMAGVQRFGNSVRAMDRLNASLMVGGPAAMPAPSPAAAGTPQLQSPMPPVALNDTQLRQAGFLVQMFDYAIEVNIVMKAATQFVGSINQLTRGQ